MAAEKSTIDLDTLLESLPACKRCRKNRRRCDTKLPSCANCTKAGIECIYYDHALQEELPRSYIASLVEHLSRDSGDSHGPVPSSAELQGRTVHASEPTNDDGRHHFAFSQGTYRYLGAGSLLLDLQLPHDATLSDLRGRPKRSRAFPSHAVTDDGQMTPDLRRYLVRLFFETVNQIYPILDPALPWLLSPDAGDHREGAGPLPLPLPPTDVFIVEMVCAIACHCDTDSTHSAMLAPLAAASHARALKHIENATAEQAVSTLQVVVLLVLYTLFRPASGNISQQLGFAIRLVIDLAESYGDDGEVEEEEQEEQQRPTLAALYKVIYCLENQVCGVLVRPTALPEPPEPLVPLSVDDLEQPLDFLCTLYRVQARCRNGAVDDALRSSVLALADEQQRRRGPAAQTLHPNVVAALCETCLLLAPAHAAAASLLAAYSDDGYVATFLSAYWVHKAGQLVIDAVPTAEGSLRPKLMLAYGQAVALLSKWSGSWEGAGTMLQALQFRLQAESSG